MLKRRNCSSFSRNVQRLIQLDRQIRFVEAVQRDFKGDSPLKMRVMLSLQQPIRVPPPYFPISKELASCLASSRLLFNSFDSLTFNHSLTGLAEDAALDAAWAWDDAV
jgi:hypothetical protein